MTAAKPVQLIAQDRLDCECRFAPVGETGEIEGVGVRFDVIDDYKTTFTPDAFGSLAGRSIPMLGNHDRSHVIGSWSSLNVRADGISAKGKLNLAVAKAQEVRALLAAGDINGLSIGFRQPKGVRQSNGVIRITEAQLLEISVVAFPAAPGSRVTSIRAPPSFAPPARPLATASASLRRK